MILGELNGAFELIGTAVPGRVRPPPGCFMFFSGLASSLWSHSFHLGLALYLTCLPFDELSLLFVCVCARELSCGGSLFESIMFSCKEKRI